jgi:hypothetical protein
MTADILIAKSFFLSPLTLTLPQGERGIIRKELLATAINSQSWDH